jgi:hypothetical protein
VDAGCEKNRFQKIQKTKTEVEKMTTRSQSYDFGIYNYNASIVGSRL